MKKKVISALLSVAMVATLLVGCGAKDEAAAPTEETKTEETATTEEKTEEVAEAPAAEEAPAADEGKVLNIRCWNEEFKSRLTDHYPGYEEVDGVTGKIGDVTVNWIIVPSDDNAYQNALDAALNDQENAADDEKVDLFLVEADYALKYVDDECTMPVADLGITDDELSKQYQYTKDIVTDSNGVLKGVSWQGCPAILFYNREAAKDVLGSDDAETVQAAVKDWDTFTATAADVAAKGYKMTATANDTYRVYSNNVSTPWVVDGKIVVDDNLKAWVDNSKKMVDAKQTATDDLWSDAWSAGFYPEGKVFCYFGPAWLINFCMAADQEGSIANLGGWGATVGPQGFFWGGTWICGATGTDNPALVADIMRQMTTNEDLMIDIVKKDDDFVNNQPAMEKMAADASYQSAVLGGINPLSLYAEGAVKIDLSNLSAYDQGCNEEFQRAMKNYFDGNVKTYEEALENFYKAVEEKYPELSH